ncbi:MAG: mannose-6-phosphate isomerase, class I [Actinomycetota bacterium]
MELLEGVVQHYDWGSTSSLPGILGRPEDGRPWAELWLGAHPSAPARSGPAGEALDEVIARDLVGALGVDAARRFGELPFLLKILAAGAPLSLQSHPSVAQAEAGFEREDAAGVPVDAPNRSFRDRNHKPELICALTPFDALCGFRSPTEALEVLATIPTTALDGVRGRLADAAGSGTDGLDGLLAFLLTLGPADAAALVEPVVAACALPGPPEYADARAMAVALGERYPGDAGVVTALLLNLVHLAPGEALFLGAGNLHAYLAGTGVEVMANSDNVLRGGLTSKHIDVSTLLDIVDAKPLEVVVQRPPVIDGVATYITPVPEFSLARFDLSGRVSVAGPAVLLCTDGTANAAAQTLERGDAAFLPARDGVVELEGRATVFVAGIGASSP